MSDERLPSAGAETAPESSGQEENPARSWTQAGRPLDREEPPATENSTPAATARAAATRPVYCVVCGATMNRGDLFCHACGWDGRVSPAPATPRLIDPNPSDLNRLAALLLCLLLGFLGVHRFYVGKTGTGLLWLVTLGFLGMGQIVDLILIATGEFRDSEGRRVLRWSEAKPG